MPFEQKLTDADRDEIIRLYIEENLTQREIAAQYGIDRTYVSKIIRESKVLDKMEMRANARSQLALIKIKNASADAAEKLIDLMQKERDDGGVYADIQLVQQVLDRAGVRATKEDDNTLTIKFAEGGGFTLGETEDVKYGDGE